MLRQRQGLLPQIYSFFDFLCIHAVFVFSWWLKFQSGWIAYENPLPFARYTFWTSVYAVVAVGIAYFLNFYVPKRKKKFSYEVFKILQIHILSLLILISILFVFKEINVSRHYLTLFLVNNIIFMIIYRFIVKATLIQLREKGYNKQYILILGAGSLGRRFYENVVNNPDLGYDVVGFLDDFHGSHEEQYSNYQRIIGKIDELESILHKIMIDEVIIALPLAAHKKFAQIINTCEKAGVKTLIIPDFFDFLPAKPYFDHFAGIPLINVRDIPLDEAGNRFIKRTFDIAFSLAALIAVLPVMCLIVVGLKLTSPGPVLFKQERVGLNRRNFMMYKFRTMKVLPKNVSDTGWTVENDPRRTRFGAFLRKTSLDELPQFINVLKGDMSVVGPRPERPFFVEQFKEDVPKYMIKHHIRPGITGWAQTNGLRGDTSIEDRIEHDIFYIENWSFEMDMKIIVKTIVNGLINKNAY